MDVWTPALVPLRVCGLIGAMLACYVDSFGFAGLLRILCKDGRVNFKDGLVKIGFGTRLWFLEPYWVCGGLVGFVEPRWVS